MAVERDRSPGPLFAGASSASEARAGATRAFGSGAPWTQAFVGATGALALFLWANPCFFPRLAEVSTRAAKAAYLGAFLAAFGAYAACICARRLWAALALAAFTASLLIDATFARVKGRALTLSDAQILRESTGNLRDAVLQYAPAVALALLSAVSLVALVLWGRFLVRRRTSLPLLACTLAAAGVYSFALVERGEQALVAFPSNLSLAFAAAALGADPVLRRVAIGEEAPVRLEAVPGVPALKHVVVIIDESIDATVFGKVLRRTSLGQSRDLGIGYASWNCSAGANLALRRGPDPDDVERSLRQLPSLFEVAKKDGFTTSYLDVQGVLEDGAVQNYFDEREKASIDAIFPVQAFGTLEYQRDLNAVKVLADFLETHARTFTIVNKLGCHFPYARRLPPELAGVANPYEAAVERNSVGFLREVAGRLPEGTVLFYTSDHGQNLEGRSTHCNLPGEAAVGEWLVPILVLSSHDMQGVAERIDAAWQDRASHAAMAEAVRNLLGVRLPAIGSLLLPPSREALARHRAFYGSPRGRFGMRIPYLVIDKARRELQADAAGKAARP